MSKFDDCVALYAGSLKDAGQSFDADVLNKVAKSLGPSIYLTDASKVSCSDDAELDRVRVKFLMGKLGLADSADLNAAIKGVCDTLGSANRNKYRAVFYYLLAEKFGKLDNYK
jgi:Protein of unknown function (DUF2853)